MFRFGRNIGFKLNQKNKFYKFKAKLFGAYIKDFNNTYKNKGIGFVHNEIEYIHHSTLPFNETVFHRLTHTQKTYFIFFGLLILILLILNASYLLIFLTTLMSILYLIDILFNFVVVGKGIIRKPEISITDDELKSLNDKDLPKYTILCPLYKEANVINQFVNAISNLDYPKEKMQVIIILEDNDKETINAVKNTKLPLNFEVVIMPDSLPKTKPKALNFGIKFAIGDLVVIYDAEDIPDPLQLKKAVIAFQKSNEKTICIQAKLNFYNSEQNILTRLFTAEYALLYGLTLPGLQSINAPIPLGGTSNHFKINFLKQLNNWDSFNVTEDCDLGIRLFKKGYLTAIVDSETMEEANSQIKNWINQRVRWQKGYMLSYLVHLRRPSEFFKNNYKIHFLTFQLILGGKLFMILINPIMWMILLINFVFLNVFNIKLDNVYLSEIAIISKFTLIFGYSMIMIFYISALIKIKKKKLIPFMIFVPIYWIMMSFSAYLALYEAYRRPHAWSKTVHGLHLNYKVSEDEKDQDQVGIYVNPTLAS